MILLNVSSCLLFFSCSGGESDSDDEEPTKRKVIYMYLSMFSIVFKSVEKCTCRQK